MAENAGGEVRMTQQQTGEEQVQNYLPKLLAQLRRTAERYGLDTVETEELTHWASMETETHSRNISELRQTLMNGLKGLSMITHRPELEDAFLSSILQAQDGIRYATVVRKPGKPGKVIAYLG